MYDFSGANAFRSASWTTIDGDSNLGQLKTALRGKL